MQRNRRHVEDLALIILGLVLISSLGWWVIDTAADFALSHEVSTMASDEGPVDQGG